MKLKATAIAFWRLFIGMLYYPIIIGLMIWLYIKDHHWIWGLCLLVSIVIFDPLWGLLAKRIISWRPKS